MDISGRKRLSQLSNHDLNLFLLCMRGCVMPVLISFWPKMGLIMGMPAAAIRAVVFPCGE